MDEIKEDFWLMLELFITGFLTAGTAGAGVAADGVVLPVLIKFGYLRLTD